jgi:c(7)-type cytochrome triheme protein
VSGLVMRACRSLTPAALLIVACVAGALGASTPGVAPAPTGRPAIPLRLPPPIVYERSVGADSAVTFSHETHVALAGNTCLGCHPEPFRMLKPVRRIVHAEMESGGSCGRCHDGRGAFGVSDAAACQGCHAGRPKAGSAARSAAAGVPARKLPGPIAFRRGESSPGAVRFRHETHPGAGCSTCHPKPFAMRSTGGRPGAAMHEAAACGGCHDGQRAFGAEDAEACARCHRDPEARP